MAQGLVIVTHYYGGDRTILDGRSIGWTASNGIGACRILPPTRRIPSINTGERLRANVAKNQTFSKYCGNSSKINSAHILTLGRPWCETNHCIVRLAEYRFIFKKIDINGIRSKERIWSSKFKANLEASRDKMKHSTAVKINQTCRTMFKYMSKAISAISAHLFTSSN